MKLATEALAKLREAQAGLTIVGTALTAVVSTAGPVASTAPLVPLSRGAVFTNETRRLTKEAQETLGSVTSRLSRIATR